MVSQLCTKTRFKQAVHEGLQNVAVTRNMIPEIAILWGSATAKAQRGWAGGIWALRWTISLRRSKRFVAAPF